jgi:uncharacterized protein with ATP-grasp and redox domains
MSFITFINDKTRSLIINKLSLKTISEARSAEAVNKDLKLAASYSVKIALSSKFLAFSMMGFQQSRKKQKVRKKGNSSLSVTVIDIFQKPLKKLKYLL